MTDLSQGKHRIRYFNWEGDACRLHEHADGTLAADIYRAGKGELPIGASDLLSGAREIGETGYRALVLEEIAAGARS